MLALNNYDRYSEIYKPLMYREFPRLCRGY